MRTRVIRVLFVMALFAAQSTPIWATEYTGTEFKIIDPVIVVGGERVTSTTYTVTESSGQNAIGESTSTSFKVRSGFQYFSVATAPSLAVTAGAEQVSLSWTASTGYLGWTITSYEVCYGTSSNTYGTCTDVGNVTSNTVTGLTAGTTYYFRVRAKTVFSVVVVRSNEASAIPTAPTPTPTPTPTPGGGGGGGGGPAPPPSCVNSVNFSGKAYPRSTVTVLKDAQIFGSTIAGSTALFSLSATDLAAGTYIFSIYGEGSTGIRSSLITFPVTVTRCTTINISDIFIAPTIDVDKSQVKLGDNISIFGQSVPSAEIVISVNSDREFFVRTKTDSGGVYLYKFDTSVLEVGQHHAKSKALTDEDISSYSKTVGFLVGNKTVLAKPSERCPVKADLNDDCRVNLIDFSIAAYWWKRAISETFRQLEMTRLSGDGKLDLVDFSIMAYYWTG